MPLQGSTRRWIIGLTTLVLLASGCSRRVLSLLVDLPEPVATEDVTSDENAAGDSLTIDQAAILRFLNFDTIRPPIEAFLDPDTVVALLPRDHSGNIDWMEALRSQVIAPRDYIPGEERPLLKDSFQFGFDFVFPGPNEMMDAVFPHSSHTQWLNCNQCHGRIFKYRDTKIGMADIFAGKYCGECHGKVSFPVMSDCERCHTGLPQPPNRATPDLLGTVVMSPAVEIEARAQDTIAAEPGLAEDDSAAATKPSFGRLGLPPAAFPHWVHRTRFQCKVCHMDIFEPKAGANAIRMRDIAQGQFCGRCHNGTVAFEAGFGQCERCHFEPDKG